MVLGQGVERQTLWSAAERRENDREDRAVAGALVDKIAAMLAHDCLLYECTPYLLGLSGRF
jgi:hypothetical protein